MQPTTIAGRYAVERAVGHGGMGTVWLCRDEVLGRLVAVKRVGTMPGETTSDVARALREARSSAALSHPNVVSVFDAVVDDDDNWLVMEYVASRTLAEILADDGPLTPERATWIGAQAADGLAAAHARGTMHRDVKPANILITADDHVKITDFGISRTRGDAQLTSTGLITGTPAYFAPETARGADPDLPADVWALGATLYAAVEGKPPYDEQGNALALLTTIATQSSPLPRRAGALTEAINRMMDRDPDARWTMAQAAAALHRLHTPPPVAGADPGAPDEQPDRTVTLAVPPAALAPDAPEATPAPVPAASRRSGRLLPAAVVLLLVALLGVVGVLLFPGDDDEPVAGDRPAVGQRQAERTDRTEEPETTEPVAPPEEPEEPEASEEPVEPETSEPVEETEPPASDIGDVEEFGSVYYGFLPGDTAAAYELLSPSYGSSFEQYDGFWRTISGVTVRDVTAVDETTVDVAITYTTNGGGTEDETRRLFLEPTDDGLRIVSDAAV